MKLLFSSKSYNNLDIEGYSFLKIKINYAIWYYTYGIE